MKAAFNLICVNIRKPKPSEGILGRTDVSLEPKEGDGPTVTIGYLSKQRGENYVSMYVENNVETRLGSYPTRSQAAHKLRKRFTKQDLTIEGEDTTTLASEDTTTDATAAAG